MEIGFHMNLYKVKYKHESPPKPNRTEADCMKMGERTTSLSLQVCVL